MNRDDAIQQMLREYMEQASPEQRKELERLLAQKKNSSSVGGMNINGMARGMARDIQKQMGLTRENIRRTARDLVVRLAKQHKPDITDRELALLLEEMIPGSVGPTNAVKKVPPDVLKTMILQYVMFKTGRMSREELRDLPPDWQKKYWQIFPDDIKNHINQFITYSIEPHEFWARIRAAMNKNRR